MSVVFKVAWEGGSKLVTGRSDGHEAETLRHWTACLEGGGGWGRMAGGGITVAGEGVRWEGEVLKTLVYCSYLNSNMLLMSLPHT